VGPVIAPIDDELAAKIRALTGSIQGDAAAAQTALAQAPAQTGADRVRELPEHRELCRQLVALRHRVARARLELTDPHALRAELATLSFFSRTLRADATIWQAAALQALEELSRREAAARRESKRLAAQREQLMHRRDALQAAIDRTAAEVAQGRRGECRRTVPVIQFADAVTVSSMTVSARRGPFQVMRLWLVTLSDGRDEVLVRAD
jgi:hypothetical protein